MALGDELNDKLLKKQTDSKESVEEEESLGKRVWKESKKMWLVAGSAIFSRFSTFGIAVVSQAFIGHIGPTELAAYAIVMTVLVRFALGVLVSVPFTSRPHFIYLVDFIYLAKMLFIHPYTRQLG